MREEVVFVQVVAEGLHERGDLLAFFCNDVSRGRGGNAAEWAGRLGPEIIAAYAPLEGEGIVTWERRG